MNPAPPPCLLFVCVENSRRSQMAEGFARALTRGRAEIFSAGSRPSGRVDPRAIRFMEERGVSIAGPTDPRGSTICPPASPGINPKGLDDAGFRGVRDRIEGLVRELVEEAVRV